MSDLIRSVTLQLEPNYAKQGQKPLTDAPTVDVAATITSPSGSVISLLSKGNPFDPKLVVEWRQSLRGGKIYLDLQAFAEHYRGHRLTLFAFDIGTPLVGPSGNFDSCRVTESDPLMRMRSDWNMILRARCFDDSEIDLVDVWGQDSLIGVSPFDIDGKRGGEIVGFIDHLTSGDPILPLEFQYQWARAHMPIPLHLVTNVGGEEGFLQLEPLALAATLALDHLADQQEWLSLQQLKRNSIRVEGETNHRAAEVYSSVIRNGELLTRVKDLEARTAEQQLTIERLVDFSLATSEGQGEEKHVQGIMQFEALGRELLAMRAELQRFARMYGVEGRDPMRCEDRVPNFLDAGSGSGYDKTKKKGDTVLEDLSAYLSTFHSHDEGMKRRKLVKSLKDMEDRLTGVDVENMYSKLYQLQTMKDLLEPIHKSSGVKQLTEIEQRRQKLRMGLDRSMLRCNISTGRKR